MQAPHMEYTEETLHVLQTEKEDHLSTTFTNLLILVKVVDDQNK